MFFISLINKMNNSVKIYLGIGGGTRRYPGTGWTNDYYNSRSNYEPMPQKHRRVRRNSQRHSHHRESSSRSRSGSSDQRASRSHSRGHSSDRGRSESKSPSTRKSREKSVEQQSSTESSPERSAEKKSKSLERSRKLSSERRSAHSSQSKDRADEDRSSDNGIDDENDAVKDIYEPSPERTSGEKQLRSSVQLIERKSSLGPKGDCKDGNSTKSQIAQGSQGAEQGTDGSSNPTSNRHEGRASGEGSSQAKEHRKAPDHVSATEEELRSVKRVVKRDSTFLAEPNESSSKTRARQQSDYFGEDRFGIESGGNMRLMSSNRNRYIDEFDTDPRGEMLTKRRRIYDEDLLYEGVDKRRDLLRADWDETLHKGPPRAIHQSNDWDREAMPFDLLDEPAMLGLGQSKSGLIRDKKNEIEKKFRQDCETFASVVKLLVCKDPDLETRLQFSLRENLKDIGQRCIQELRDFIDRVKFADEPTFRK